MFKKNNPGCGCTITAENVGVCQALVTWNACVPIPNSVTINTGTTSYEGLPNSGSMVVNELGPFTLTVTDCFGNVVCTATELFRCIAQGTPAQTGTKYAGVRYSYSVPAPFNGIPSGLPSTYLSGSSANNQAVSPFHTGPCTNPQNVSGTSTPYYYNTYTLDYVDIDRVAGTFNFDAPFLTIINCQSQLTPISPAVFASHVHEQWVYDWQGRQFTAPGDVLVDSGTFIYHVEYDIYIDSVMTFNGERPRVKFTNFNYYNTGTLPANNSARIPNPFGDRIITGNPFSCPPFIVEYDFDSDNDTINDSWSDRLTTITNGTLLPC